MAYPLLTDKKPKIIIFKMLTINRGHLRDKDSLGKNYRNLLEFTFCERPAYALLKYLAW